MSEKKLKFVNISVNEKEFHKSKQPIDLDLINVDQIVVSDKFKHIDSSIDMGWPAQNDKMRNLRFYDFRIIGY